MRRSSKIGLARSQSPRRPFSSQFVFPKYSHDNLGFQSPGSVYQGGMLSSRGNIFSRGGSRERPLSCNSRNNLFKQMALKMQKEKQSTIRNNIDIQEEYYSSTNK
jgi:hypothetical protein